MPELPDVVVHLEALTPRILGQPLGRFRLGNPFIVRTIEPAPAEFERRRITALRRLGKRLVFDFEGDLFLVLHLIAGRLRWRDRGAAIPGKAGLAAFDFPSGTLLLTEAGAKRQASIHLVRGAGALADFDRGGLEVLDADLASFADLLTRDNHTLKRALTDPTIFSGIGNAYSDEILHAAKLSAMRQTRQLSDTEIARLHVAVIQTLESWIERTRDEVGGRFPEKVTAFRQGMTVHGRFGCACVA